MHTVLLEASRICAALSVSASLVVAQSAVWTVDDDAPADFADLQPAIDAASPGDVLLVRSGEYSEFLVDGKGVSIVADAGASVRVLATAGSMTSTIRNVPIGQRALVRGVTFVEPLAIDAELIEVDDNRGVVWLEEVVVELPPPVPFGYSIRQAQVVHVVDSDSVVFVRSELLGSPGGTMFPSQEFGSQALATLNSTVFLSESRILGSGTVVQGGLGPSALEVTGGTVVLRECEVTGGTGGAAGIFGPPAPGNGGPAIDVSGAAEVWSIGTNLIGGQPGLNLLSGLPPANPGPPFASRGGSTVNVSSAVSATLTSTRVGRDTPSTELDFTLTTERDAVVILLIDFASAPTLLPTIPDYVASGLTPLVIAAAGTTDASGHLGLSIGIPTLPIGLDTWNATIQFAVLTPVNELNLSTPSVFTVVDDRF